MDRHLPQRPTASDERATSRRLTGASLALGAIVLVVTLAGLVLMAANWPLPLSHAEWGFPGFQAIAALVFGAVGTAVAIRRPGNPIGWLWHAGAVLSAVQFLGHQYALHGLVKAPGSVPAPSVGTWIEEWVWMPILSAIGVFTFLLFPTGRLLSPRWRLVAWVAAGTVAVGTIASALVPTTRVPGAVNPLVPGGTPPFAEGLAYLAASILAAMVAFATASLAIRFRRSTGVERQQLKWLALGAVVVCLGLTLQTVQTVATGAAFGVSAAVAALSLLALPLSIALATLRYGLYEVDRLINRTVVYAVVSILLVSLYGASVLVLQPLLHPVTGGDTLAVAGSTLLVALIFQPVRRRVQHGVDRRFFRSRYDAQRSAERLAARLREEVDPDRLGEVLLAEVAQAVHPAGASIWLRRR